MSSLSDLDDFFAHFTDELGMNSSDFCMEADNNETSSLENLKPALPDFPSDVGELSSNLLSNQEYNPWECPGNYPKMEDLFEATGDFLQSGNLVPSTGPSDQTEELCPFASLLSPSYKFELPDNAEEKAESLLDFWGSQISQDPPMDEDTSNSNPSDMIPCQPFLDLHPPPATSPSEVFQVDTRNELKGAVESIKLPNLSLHEETIPAGAARPRINCSRIKYMEAGKTNDKNVVRFSTYPAVKKKGKQDTRKRSKQKKALKYVKVAPSLNRIASTSDANVILPVGESGCQIAIPSTIPVHLESFLYDKEQRNKYPLEDSTNKILQSDQPSQPVFKLTSDGCVVENPRSSLTPSSRAPCIVKKVLPATTGKEFTVNPSFPKPGINPEGKTGIQILNKTPSNHRNFFMESNYTPAIRENMEKVTSFLYANIKGLTSDILDSLSVPVFIVRRGSLSNSEFHHIVKQVYLLQKLKTFSHHSCYEGVHCLVCKEIARYKSKLIELKKWKNFSEMTSQRKNRNNFSCVKVIDRDFSFGDPKNKEPIKIFSHRTQKQPLKFQVDDVNRSCLSGVQTLPVLHFGTNNNAKVFLKDQLSSMLRGGSIFNVRQLDVGKVTTVSDDNHNGITLFFLENSFFYEIELQNEYFYPNDESNYKIFYISIEVPFSSLCRLQTPRDQQIELVIKEVPSLKLISKKSNKRIILSEDKIPLSDQQRSLVSSMRTQLSVNLTHKLHLIKRNFKLVKNCFKNACQWLDITKNSVKPISAFSCNQPNYSTVKKGPAMYRTQKMEEIAPKPSGEEKNVVLINIFSGDPSKNSEIQKSDDPVWAEGKATPIPRKIR